MRYQLLKASIIGVIAGCVGSAIWVAFGLNDQLLPIVVGAGAGSAAVLAKSRRTSSS